MKNQYVGDIGDYGKYGLLRFLATKGIKIGINWYLTENDNTNDGKFRNYFDDNRGNGEKCCDEILFEKLKPIAKKSKEERNVQDVECSEIIPDAVFFHELLQRNKEYRDKWHTSAMIALQDADLIFADPDNGTLISRNYAPNSEKYAFIDELRDYYDRGQNVVYYCHKGRRKEDDWASKLDEFNQDGRHCAKIFVLTFHRGTQRSFVFAIHPERAEEYYKLLKEFLDSPWGTISVDRKRAPFTLTKAPTDKSPVWGNGIITLHEASASDAALLCEKMNLSEADAEDMIGASKTHTCNGRFFELFVISKEKTIVGTVSLYERSACVVFIGPEIFAEHRRLGYGAEAMRLAMTAARSRGYQIVSQQIRTNNAASLRLHEKLGFETDGYVYQNRNQNDVFLFLKSL